jgi:uncharacterized protein
MAKPDSHRVSRTALVVLSLGFVVWLAVAASQYLTMAAGASSGESYILSNALKTVVERHYPRIRITLLETGGTVENLEMLEQGRAQLVTGQADVLPGPSARIVAVLYDDAFQLMVHKSAPLQNCACAERGTVPILPSGD